MENAVSLYSLFASKWARTEKPVIIFNDQSITWAELEAKVMQVLFLFEELDLGLGDVIALQMPKCVEFQATLLAALASGVTIVPLNPQYTEDEVTYALSDSAAKFAILTTPLDHSTCTVWTIDRLREGIHQSPQLDNAMRPGPPPDSLAFLCYTSGTTGRPKAAMIRHENIRHTLQALHETWQWSESDTLLHVLPMFHIHGLFVAQFGAFFAGATSIWLDRFDPKLVLEHLQTISNGVFMGVPTHYYRLLTEIGNQTFTLPNMRLFTSGSAPLPAPVHDKIHSAFGHKILERYGMTEVGIVLSNPYMATRVPGTVGHPLPGIDARVCDEKGTELPRGEIGELRIKGPSVMQGYLNRPKATAEALVGGWMRTGDVAIHQPDGYFKILGRNNDMIISGGLNVYPREIEKRLLEHPNVTAVAVIGVPDPDFGEQVVAVVESNESDVNSIDLIQFAQKTLAKYKCPKVIVPIPDIPRNAMGKVQKHLLRKSWPLYIDTSWSSPLKTALLRFIHDQTRKDSTPVAAFDFDNTCIAGDIGEAVLLEIQRQQKRDLLSPYQRLCAEEGKRIGYVWCAEQCAGYTEEEIFRLTRQQFRDAMDRGQISVRSGITSLIQCLKAHGWDVRICTASAEVIVQAISEEVGIPSEDVIGMKLPKDPSGRLLVGVLEPATVYEGKAEAILQSVGTTPTLAAGDSDTDYEMIDAAQFGIVIDRGQPKLRALADDKRVWMQTDWSTLSME